jgi:hypothetical protein
MFKEYQLGKNDTIWREFFGDLKQFRDTNAVAEHQAPEREINSGFLLPDFSLPGLLLLRLYSWVLSPYD